MESNFFIWENDNTFMLINVRAGHWYIENIKSVGFFS